MLDPLPEASHLRCRRVPEVCADADVVLREARGRAPVYRRRVQPVSAACAVVLSLSQGDGPLKIQNCVVPKLFNQLHRLCGGTVTSVCRVARQSMWVWLVILRHMQAAERATILA